MLFTDGIRAVLNFDCKTLSGAAIIPSDHSSRKVTFFGCCKTFELISVEIALQSNALCMFSTLFSVKTVYILKVYIVEFSTFQSRVPSYQPWINYTGRVSLLSLESRVLMPSDKIAAIWCYLQWRLIIQSSWWAMSSNSSCLVPNLDFFSISSCFYKLPRIVFVA